MPEPLIGKSELPPVSILQMILEGPKGYFGRRGKMSDEQWLQQQQQQQQGQFAQGLVGTPEWKAAMTHPYDRLAQGGLWAVMEGGPGNMATQGANWLQTAISGAYGREQQTYGGQLQLQQQAAGAALQQQQTRLENTLQLGRMAVANTYQQGMSTFEDALQKSRMTMSTDEALRLEQGKIELANKQMQDQLKLFMPDPQTGTSPAQSQGMNDIRYDMGAHTFGWKARPEGYSWNPQQAMMEPTYGGPVWQKMTEELDPLQAINGAVDKLIDMDKINSTDVGTRQSLIAQVKDQIRLASKGGAMDKDMQDALEQQISSYNAVTGEGNYIPFDSKSSRIAQEKLQALKIKTGNQIVAWQRKYMVDPRGLGDPFAYTPAAQKVPKPSETADEAMKKLQPPVSQSQPAPSSKVNRGQLPAGAPSIFDTGPGRDTGMSSRGRGGK